MPKVTFLPAGNSADVEEKTKLLLCAKKAAVNIRFACASCRCGTCAIRVEEGQQNLSPMKTDEQRLLKRLKLNQDGSIRLACQARVQGDCNIDLTFQDEYDTPEGFEDDDEDA